MGRKRREAQSSTLSFMDCICCGFGAVLLLFILTAKNQITLSAQEAAQAAAAAETLTFAIEEARARNLALDQELSALDPIPDTDATSISELAAERERLNREIESMETGIAALQEKPTEDAASLERPSADRSYLTGLKLHGPRILILVENTGSMLAEDAASAVSILQAGTGDTAEKWLRTKRVVRSVLAAIPKGSEVALFQVNESTGPVSPTPENPWFDPYDNGALVAVLERLEKLEAGGGSNLANAFLTIAKLRPAASSILLITDSLPTAPAPRGTLSESDRVELFNRAYVVSPGVPVNVILLPFEGDPAAAGLFWNLSGKTDGVTIIPNRKWPPE